MVKWGRQPPVWKSKRINAETRRSLMKWYIGKFPLPRRVEKIPKPTAAKLNTLLEKSEPWSRGEEEVNRVVEELKNVTLSSHIYNYKH